MGNVPKLTRLQMIIRFINMLIRKWNEGIILFPIAIASWIYAPLFIHWIDPTAAIFDTGYLMKFMYAVIGTVICHFTAWIMLYFTFPTIHKYLYHTMSWDLYDQMVELKGEAKRHNECKRLRYSLIVFSLYLFTFIAILFTV